MVTQPELRNQIFNLSESLNSTDDIQLEKGFPRDVRHIGHLGTGYLEITIRSK